MAIVFFAIFRVFFSWKFEQVTPYLDFPCFFTIQNIWILMETLKSFELLDVKDVKVNDTAWVSQWEVSSIGGSVFLGISHDTIFVSLRKTYRSVKIGWKKCTNVKILAPHVNPNKNNPAIKLGQKLSWNKSNLIRLV